MGVGMLFFGLAFMGGWADGRTGGCAAALGALVYAAVTLVRIWPEDWLRRHGHPVARLLMPAPAFTEDWMGYPAMMDLTGRGYQAGVVSALHSTAWWTCGIAVLGRCRLTAGAQVCLLPLAAWWIGAFDTYYT
ncbi:hypothetical protein [Streptomyces sp. NPDC050164]|uniref:hypothetical protein n=1 Tax=Streptomyces sp. NPDC050164 TaxID=3365605 RepID=UPI0037BC59B4